ncbi:MAG: hypothetical protein AB1657_05305 [Candidatus Micrarchaeota archaeon]
MKTMETRTAIQDRTHAGAALGLAREVCSSACARYLGTGNQRPGPKPKFFTELGPLVEVVQPLGGLRNGMEKTTEGVHICEWNGINVQGVGSNNIYLSNAPFTVQAVIHYLLRKKEYLGDVAEEDPFKDVPEDKRVILPLHFHRSAIHLYGGVLCQDIVRQFEAVLWPETLQQDSPIEMLTAPPVDYKTVDISRRLAMLSDSDSQYPHQLSPFACEQRAFFRFEPRPDALHPPSALDAVVLCPLLHLEALALESRIFLDLLAEFRAMLESAIRHFGGGAT